MPALNFKNLDQNLISSLINSTVHANIEFLMIIPTNTEMSIFKPRILPGSHIYSSINAVLLAVMSVLFVGSWLWP